MEAMGLTEALEEAVMESSPSEVVGDRFLERAARLSGMRLSDLRKMNEDGSLDRFLSERFFYLSLVAAGACLEGIEAGEVEAVEAGRIAMDSAKVGQKLAGRDIDRKYIVNADVWEHAALMAEDSEDDG